MPTTTIAQMGDTLCNIAHLNGFNDCTALRSEPANAFIMQRAADAGQVFPGDVVTIPDLVEKNENGSTEQVHNFVKRTNLISIRIVHGSPNLPYRDDPTLINLNISNYVADRAGTADGSQALPNSFIRKFNAAGHADSDTFKVEVTDIRASGDIKVDLEVLRPVYTAGVVTSHTQFPAANRAERELKGVIASKQGSTQCFRTCYLKLVTDEVDRAAARLQTLMTADMHDEGDSQVEILDQLVKASYEFTKCPQNPKCRATVTLPIGTDRRRIRLAVHVLRATPGGALVVPLAAAERRVHKWFRRCFAQAAVGPKLMQATRGVDPPANLIAISNDSGLTALGDGQFAFDISAAGHPTQNIGPITPNPGDTPLTTANALAALVSAPFAAAVSENPERFNDALGSKSADIVITANDGARVTLSIVTQSETRQTIAVGLPNPLNFESWAFPVGNNNWNAGSLEQRTVLKNHDTGDDRIDVFVVQQVTAGNRAEAMMSNHRIDPNRASITQVKNSAFMTATTMDATNDNPFVLPHEIGHVVGELVHAPAAAPPNNAEVMDRRGTEVTNAANASKRIRDGAVRYDAPRVNSLPADFNLIDRMRIEGAPLLEAW